VVRAHPTVPRQQNPLWFQQRTDRPDVFARAKYKRRIQMALRMGALDRAKDGCWFARKGIPKDVRDPYSQHFTDSYQVMGSDERLKMTINGEPVAEIDIGASYLTIFLSLIRCCPQIISCYTTPTRDCSR
jgi:hypothetical protein